MFNAVCNVDVITVLCLMINRSSLPWIMDGRAAVSLFPVKPLMLCNPKSNGRVYYLALNTSDAIT